MIKVIEAKLNLITCSNMNARQCDMKLTSLRASTINIEDFAMLYQVID